MTEPLTRSLLLLSDNKTLQSVWIQFRSDKVSGLFWIQTICPSDGNARRLVETVDFETKTYLRQAEDAKISQHPNSYRYICVLIGHPI